MADLALVLGDAAADFGHQPLCHLMPLLTSEAVEAMAFEGRLGAMILEPVSSLVDDAQSGLIRLLGGLAPGEEPMGAQHHADEMRIGTRHLAELEAEIEARPLPGQIAHLVAEDLTRELF